MLENPSALVDKEDALAGSRVGIRSARPDEMPRVASIIVAAFIADRIVRCHLQTMRRLNIDYDLLTWEGDILRLQFWNKAFERLKAQGTVYFQDSGRLNGCWVMRIEDGVEHASREARAADVPAEGAEGEGGEEDQASADADKGKKGKAKKGKAKKGGDE